MIQSRWDSEFDLNGYPASGSSRGLRGGSWGDFEGYLRSSARLGGGPSYEASPRRVPRRQCP